MSVKTEDLASVAMAMMGDWSKNWGPWVQRQIVP